jgi:tRNA nucleotidyltransferase (CCA-adding enzyme)
MAPSLMLDQREKLLRDCLAECAQTVHPLEIRFAGGWVRDKLLGLQSSDIDAALSTLSGKDFGQIFLAFYDKHGTKYKEEADRLGIGNTELNKIVLVEEDASKSKHLAVAKMKLFGLEVDLVNLRTEVYASDSRTPVVEMGTAEEDALRRDATINALFYNIHTERVEDFTGRGLDDMKNKIMRTPLDPYQTFRDDPLRVLRLIRFASRLDFEIDAAVKLAMKSPSIHEALRLKISRERVRAEIMKALEGPGPAQALLYIHQLDLFSACFAHPTKPNLPPSPNLPRISRALGKILANDLLSNALQLRQDNSALPWLLAAYVPWAPLPAEEGRLALKEAMKATVKESRLWEACQAHKEQIQTLVARVSSDDDINDEYKNCNNSIPPTRGKTGMALRRWGPTWGHQVLFSLLCELEDDDTAATGRYEAFARHLQRIGLDGTRALDEKPVLDGRRIMKVLAKGNAGPWNRLAADLVMEWQFDNPGEDVRQCEEMLVRRRGEIFDREDGRDGRGRGVG